MSGYVGGQKGLLCKSDLHPASWYRGSNLIAGYKSLEQTGTALAFADTYNDTVQGLTVFGKSTQVQTTQGKNLFDKTKIVKLAMSSTITAGDNYRGYFAECKPNTLYSVHRVTQTTNRLVLCFTTVKPANDVAYYNASLAFTTDRTNADVTIQATSAADSKYIFVYLSNQADSIPDVMLCEGTISAWEPFVPNSPSPDYPSPIVSVGDTNGVTVTATDGATKSVSATRSVILRSTPSGARDQINGITGEVMRNIGIKVFEGTETIVMFATSNDASDACYYANAAELGIYGTPKFVSVGYCSHFAKVDSVYGTGLTTSKFCLVTNSNPPYIGFRITRDITGITSSDSDATKVSKIKTYFAAQYAAGTPVTVLYELATPTTESVTPITLPTYPGHTHIDAGGAEMTATCRVVDL